MNMYELEILISTEHSVSGDRMDEIVGQRLFRCGGGPIDRVYGYKFSSREEAEVAKNRVWCRIPQSHFSIKERPQD